MLSKKELWDKVKHTWHQAESFYKSASSRVKEGKVSKEIKSLRILSCHGINEEGKQVRPACHARLYSPTKKFFACNLCGCGEREIARISSFNSKENQPTFNEDEYIKLDFPTLQCPRKMPGFSNFEGNDKIL